MNTFKTNKLLSVALAILLLAGCSNFNQDPLKDYPDNIRNGVPPSELQAKPDRSPLCQECFRIDVDDVVEFSEGQEISMDIGARIFVPADEFSLSVDNADAFVGYKFEEDTTRTTSTEKRYKFTWIAPAGFTGSNLYTVVPFNLKLIAVTGKQTEIVKTIKIIVNRSFRVPRVVSADFDLHQVAEGAAAKLNVVVEDPDSTDAEPPRLQFDNPQNATSDASVFLNFNSVARDTSGANRWKITYDFNTKDNNLTNDQKKEAVALKVISRFGVKSQTSRAELFVVNSLKEAVASINSKSTFNFVKGVRNAMSFTVFDPTFDGDVSARLKTNTATLPGTVALSCVKPDTNLKYFTNCEFSWDIPAASNLASSNTFDVELNNTGLSASVPVTKTSTTTFTVMVPATSPSPMPSPSPSPDPNPVPNGGN